MGSKDVLLLLVLLGHCTAGCSSGCRPPPPPPHTQTHRPIFQVMSEEFLTSHVFQGTKPANNLLTRDMTRVSVLVALTFAE